MNRKKDFSIVMNDGWREDYPKHFLGFWELRLWFVWNNPLDLLKKWGLGINQARARLSAGEGSLKRKRALA